ncbi:MAG: AAA family ATPase [Endomicrobiia bacterium]|nr:MAG: AAA family ATPase [Endomicrobiia bacterium]
MKEIVSIVHQKGGSGKTTTAHTLGVGLRKRGFKVLFIDMDGQASLSVIMQADQNKSGLLALLDRKASVREIVQKTPNGDILAGSENLFQADTLISGVGKEYRLKKALEDVKDEYDYIVIDTPPALSALTVNALVASNSAIIASQAEWLNLNCIGNINKTIEAVREYCNEKLAIKGILLTQFRERTRLNKAFATAISSVADKLGSKVFKTPIRASIIVSEAQVKHVTVFDYAPTSNVAKEYEAFIDEFLQT